MKTMRRMLVLCAALVAAAAPSVLRGAGGGGFELQGKALHPGEAPAAGGGFALAGEVVPRIFPQRGGFVLTSSAASCGRGLAKAAAGGCGCLCSSAIFTDGFESGNTNSWSASQP